MRHPFDGDIFALLYDEFEKMYPSHPDIIVQWATQEEFDDYDSDGDVNGMCEWRDDGNIVVSVSLANTVEDALMVLAHELSHVAVGYDHHHDKKFIRFHIRLWIAFNRRLEKEFGNDKADKR